MTSRNIVKLDSIFYSSENTENPYFVNLSTNDIGIEELMFVP